MLTTRFRLLAVAVLAATVAIPAMGAKYQEVFPFSTIQAVDPTISLHQIANSEGNVAYSIVRGGTASPYHSYIVKTSDLGGTPTSTAVTDTASAAWSGTGVDYILPGNTLAFVADDLLFGDIRSDQVYNVDKTTGAPTVYLSKAQLQASIGGDALTGSNGVTPAGEYVVYETDTDQIVVTNGAGNVSVLVSNAQLMAAQGNDTVSGGLTYDAAGNLYWGNTTTDDLWMRDTSGVVQQILSKTDITSVTGATAAGFGDIFHAPDGLIYHRDTSAKAILSFDPTNPVSTLAMVLTQTDLESGPAGTAYVDPFSWYAGTDNLAFATIGSGNKGYYSIPEPLSLMLLGIGGLFLIRHRRS